VGTISLCIVVRPLCGVLSDNLPICGSTRRAYFLLAASGSSACYLALTALRPLEQLGALAACGLLSVANVLGYAWCVHHAAVHGCTQLYTM
jgi:hypothetical protein